MCPRLRLGDWWQGEAGAHFTAKLANLLRQPLMVRGQPIDPRLQGIEPSFKTVETPFEDTEPPLEAAESLVHLVKLGVDLVELGVDLVKITARTSSSDCTLATASSIASRKSASKALSFRGRFSVRTAT